MNKPILVQKYGGSSVADVPRLLKIAQRVVKAKERGYAVVVVVSAMGDSTDSLVAMAKAITDDPPRRELDMLVSAGERISMALLSMAIQHYGYEAISFTGSQCGILTNDRHYDAQIIEVRPVRIQDELARDKVVIVAGYQGMSYKREITTLGRGGSDTTAVALAAALDAEACEIYSDVDGVYDGDPRVILDAKRLSSVGFDEMEELARHGAKVLHAEALEFARAHQIALYVKSSSGGNGGTLIRKDLQKEPKTPLVVSALSDLLWLKGELSEKERKNIFSILEERRTIPRFSERRDAFHEWIFSLEDSPDLTATLEKILSSTPQLSLHRAATVHLIGRNINSQPTLLDQAHHILHEELGEPPLKSWREPLRLNFLITPQQITNAQKILYRFKEKLES